MACDDLSFGLQMRPCKGNRSKIGNTRYSRLPDRRETQAKQRTQAIVKKSDFVTGHKNAHGSRLENTQTNPRLVACSDAHNCTFATPCRRRPMPGAASTRRAYGCAFFAARAQNKRVR
jgi:hypothetical protein